MLSNPKWRPIFVEHLQLAASLNINSNSGKKRIENLAADFISDLVKKKLISSGQVKNAIALESAILRHTGAETISAEIVNLLSQIENAELRHKLQCIIGRAISDSREMHPCREDARRQDPLQEIGLAQEDSCSQEIFEQQAEVVGVGGGFQTRPLKKARKSGPFDVDEREMISNCKIGAEKMKLIESAHGKILRMLSDAGNEVSVSGLLTDKCRQFWIRSVQPIIFCLQHHCGGSHSEFIRRWGPQVKHSKWKGSHCKTDSIETCSFAETG
jgi:hypothetical protein